VGHDDLPGRFSGNRGAKFLKIFQKAEILPRFWNFKRRFKMQLKMLRSTIYVMPHFFAEM